MQIATGIIIVIAVIGLLAYFFVSLSKDEAVKSERPDDEFIYDPSSGRKITLEEVQRGYHVADSELDRIKTDEEISSYYSEDEQQVEYIERDLGKAKLMALTDDEADPLINLLQASEMKKKFNSLEVISLYEIKQNTYFGIIHITNSYMARRYVETTSEDQLIGVIRKSTGEKLSGLPEKYDVELLNGIIIIRSTEKAKHKDAKELMEILMAF